MKKILLAAACTMNVMAAWAQQAPAPKKPSGPYQICLWPNPCAPRGGQTAPKAPASEEAKPQTEAVPTDPLTQAVIQGTVGNEGIVSSIRLSKEHTGVARDQIVTRGTGLRDALAPVGTAGLPSSAVPPSKNGAKKAADDDWVEVDSKSPSAGQLNDMRGERKALKTGAESSSGALGRMYKDKK